MTQSEAMRVAEEIDSITNVPRPGFICYYVRVFPDGAVRRLYRKPAKAEAKQGSLL